jgi:hypothetical protein
MHTDVCTLCIISGGESRTSPVCMNYRLHLVVCVTHTTLHSIVFTKHNTDMEVIAEIWSRKLWHILFYQYPLHLSSTYHISMPWKIISIKRFINIVLPREILATVIFTPWSESASELYRPSNRRLSAK